MSVLVLTILEKIKKTRLRFSEGRKSSLIRDDNYQEARVELTNTQLKKYNLQQKIILERY